MTFPGLLPVNANEEATFEKGNKCKKKGDELGNDLGNEECANRIKSQCPVPYGQNKEKDGCYCCLDNKKKDGPSSYYFISFVNS